MALDTLRAVDRNHQHAQLVGRDRIAELAGVVDPFGRSRRAPRATATRSTPCGVANSCSNSGSSCRRQVREDPAAVVVDDDERRGHRSRAEQTVRVVQEAQIAAQRRPSAPARCACATPTTVDTKPSMPLAPRFASTRNAGARRHAPLEGAHRQARRHDERAAVGQRGRDVARDAAFARDRRRRARASIAARPRVRPRASPRATSSATRPVRARRQPRRATRRRRPRTRSAAACCGSSHASSGSTSTCATPVEPRGRDLARERRADAHDEIGTVRARERVDAEQRLVRRDRVRTASAAARADRRATGQPAAAREARRDRRRHARAPPRDEQPAWMRAHERGEARDVGRRRLAASRRRARSTGARRRGPACRPAARPVGTSGSRNGRLRCTGPGGRADATRRPRGTRAHASAIAPRRVVASGGPGSWNQRTAPPNRCGLVDGLARARVAQLRRADRRCTRAAARGRGAPRPPPGASSRPRCPTCSTRPRAGRSRVPMPSARNPAERSSSTT